MFARKASSTDFCIRPWSHGILAIPSNLSKLAEDENEPIFQTPHFTTHSESSPQTPISTLPISPSPQRLTFCPHQPEASPSLSSTKNAFNILNCALSREMPVPLWLDPAPDERGQRPRVDRARHRLHQHRGAHHQGEPGADQAGD